MATKLGPHVLRGTEELPDYIQTRPAVIKLVGGWGMADSVPEGVLVIGRKHQGDYDAQLQYNTDKTPLQAAKQFVQDQLDTYQSNSITYWEGHNEPVWSTEEEMAWYAQFEIERMKLMADLGYKCVLGNFATGTPPLELWPAFLPAIEAGLEYEAILGLHEYSCPWMWWMTGKHQLGPEEDQGDEGWTTLRYRKVYRQYLIPNGTVIPLVITEGGIDPLVNPKPPGTPDAPWKGLGKFWKKKDKKTDKEDYYFRQLVWYDEEMQKDYYVVGMTLFTWGSFGDPWEDFDVTGTEVAEKLIDYTRENPAQSFVYSKYSKQKSEKKPRGKPRAQYDRTYVLLPPDADTAWARAVVEGSWNEKRYTIGSSADDAGIGDLDVRRVIAVNPHRWPGPTSLKEFYEKYYPGVEYTSITAETPAKLKEKLAKL